MTAFICEVVPRNRKLTPQAHIVSYELYHDKVQAYILLHEEVHMSARIYSCISCVHLSASSIALLRA